ncbi:hypothetical protein PsYK624_162950 [Phanerochaete sordida]|uniref:F-box domain-containing protein n=1 Tax=Phanerochaete sordida TaxID=48140 RepID=A0A9P3LN99_9APHY|nr:hypothetical protein PsYK624_162950 [Phanerochaete sordida]
MPLRPSGLQVVARDAPVASGTALRRMSRRFSILAKPPHSLTSRTLPILNFDIFTVVLEFLDLKDLLSAMTTCRTLYKSGIPVLLRNVELHRWRNHIRRFEFYKRHLLKDPARFHCVRRLTCCYFALVERDLIGFSRIYRALPLNFTSLRSLDLCLEAEAMRGTLCTWVLSLKHLRELRLRKLGPYTKSQMAFIKSISGRLDLFHISTTSLTSSKLISPLQLLSDGSHSIRSLAWEHTRMKGGPAILPDVDTVVFPNVYELTWSSSRWVTACVLISKFPSVRRLHIGHPELELTDYVARHRLQSDFLLALRIANRESQSCCRRQWQSLDVLRGCAVTLWTLGLRCRVARLETTLWRESDKPGHVLAVMYDTWPAHLDLSIIPCFAAHLAQILSFPSLRSVKLTFFDALVKENVEILQFLRDTLPTVCRPQVRQLTIAITASWFMSVSGSWLQGSAEDAAVAASRSLPARWRTYIPAIREAFPLLEELNVDIRGCRPFVWKRESGVGMAKEGVMDVSETMDNYHGPPLCKCLSA